MTARKAAVILNLSIGYLFEKKVLGSIIESFGMLVENPGTNRWRRLSYG
jgi:hypothetical protein